MDGSAASYTSQLLLMVVGLARSLRGLKRLKVREDTLCSHVRNATSRRSRDSLSRSICLFRCVDFGLASTSLLFAYKYVAPTELIDSHGAVSRDSTTERNCWALQSRWSSYRKRLIEKTNYHKLREVCWQFLWRVLLQFLSSSLVYK